MRNGSWLDGLETDDPMVVAELLELQETAEELEMYGGLGEWVEVAADD